MVTENNTPTSKKHNSKKILVFRAVLAVIISVVIGFGAYTLNVRALSGDQMPMPLGIGVGVIMSGSMEPELSVDDVIIVKVQDSYEIGDIVVFQSHGMLVVHKIIAMDGDTVITQGTANNVADDPISASAIKGRVVHHIDGAGIVVDFMQSPLGAGIILLLAGFLLVKSYRSEKAEKQAANNADLEKIRAEIAALKGIAPEDPDSADSANHPPH